MWTLKEAGPPDASRRALLLPGMFCTAAFYDAVLADERWEEEAIRLFAATPPGFGGTPLPAPHAPTVEDYAGLVGRLADELETDLIVGHSYFANVAIETAAAAGFTGRLLLLSPCFSSEDEIDELKQLAKANRIPGVGRLVMSRVIRTFPSTMRDQLPEPSAAALGAEMASSDQAVFRPLLRQYFEHLDRHDSLVERLCATGIKATVARGESDEVALSDAERDALGTCSSVTLVDVPGSGHFVMNDQPEWAADMISELA